MEMWALIAVYLIGFAFLQLYLYQYYIKGNSTGRESAAKTATPRPDGTAPSVERGETADSEILACGDCGTNNEYDPAFTFCKACGSRL